MVRYVNGNILSGLDDSQRIFICQQVNCQGVMGAGLAKQIRAKWPVVFTEYKSLCDKNCQKYQLGDCQVVEVDKKICIANIFGQLNYGTDKRYTSYFAISLGFHKLFNNYWTPSGRQDLIFRIPYGFGCGLGGGDWDVVSSIIEDAAYQYDMNVEIWKLS